MIAIVILRVVLAAGAIDAVAEALGHVHGQRVVEAGQGTDAGAAAVDP